MQHKPVHLFVSQYGLDQTSQNPGVSVWRLQDGALHFTMEHNNEFATDKAQTASRAAKNACLTAPLSPLAHLTFHRSYFLLLGDPVRICAKNCVRPG